MPVLPQHIAKDQIGHRDQGQRGVILHKEPDLPDKGAVDDAGEDHQRHADDNSRRQHEAELGELVKEAVDLLDHSHPAR